MMRGSFLIGVMALVASVRCAALGAIAPTVVAGFTIEQVAKEPAVRFPMFACLDDKGRLYVAESSGLDLYVELQKQTRKCRISRLEDRDGDGKYEHAEVFADKLVFPMGLAWRDGKLYVADPPELVTLEDRDGDGKADKRTRILIGFGHQDNGSLHGLTFGPDGWLYMTTGNPDGYRLKRADGTTLEGQCGALLRCRADGSDVQVVARGFENLVEIVFLADGRMIGTDNWFSRPEGGVRDALVHLIEGGQYPLHLRDHGTPQPMTGDPLPAVAMFPAVALSGMAYCDGRGFDPTFSGQLFTAQHNARKIGRHALKVAGSTFSVDSFDLVSSEDPDFHPSDVLFDRDGSMLIIDTGGWYVQHCPTGKIRDSKAPGGIWRVRAEKPADKASGMAAVDVWSKGTSELVTLATHERPELAAAACRALAMKKEKSAEKVLWGLLHSKDLPLRLAAAEALAHCGTNASVPVIVNALMEEVDAFLEHALVHALHRVGTNEQLAALLGHDHPRVVKAAMVLLDQAPRKMLSVEDVLRAKHWDPGLQRTVLRILRNHPEWSKKAMQLVHGVLMDEQTPPALLDQLTEVLVAFQGDASVGASIGDVWKRGNVAKRRWVLRTMKRLLAPTSGSWNGILESALGDQALRSAAIAVIRAHQIAALDEQLAKLAADDSIEAGARVDAAGVLVVRKMEIPDALFKHLLAACDRTAPAALRLGASEVLGKAILTAEQLTQVLAAVKGDRLIAPDVLLPMILRSNPAEVGTEVMDYLETAVEKGYQTTPAKLAEALRPLERTQGERIKALLAQVGKNLEGQLERLTKYERLIGGGNAARGREVFVSQSVACATCHRVGTEGGSIGPDLTRAGAIRSGRDLVESIVFPSSTFAQGYEPYVVTLKDKQQLSGIIVEKIEQGLTIRDSAGAERRIASNRIASVRRETVSIMPEGLDSAMTEEELRDLLAYLQSLK